MSEPALQEDKMPGDVVYAPFVGRSFGDGKTRLLILGESHYGFGREDSGATDLVVSGWQKGDNKLRFLTVLARLLHGKSASDIDRSSAFEEVAIYNYHQAPILEGKSTDFSVSADQSRAAFLQVIDDLKPTHIYVNGVSKLWSALPEGKASGRMKLADQERPFRIYDADGEKALAVPFPHASRMSADAWRDVYDNFIEWRGSDIFG